jgi:hypothetical protein
LLILTFRRNTAFKQCFLGEASAIDDCNSPELIGRMLHTYRTLKDHLTRVEKVERILQSICIF